MREKNPRNVWHIFEAILGMSAFGFYIHTFEPSSWIHIGGFFLLFFFTTYLLLLFLLNNVRHATFGSAALSGILGLRALGLREIYYMVFFLITLFALERYFKNDTHT